MDNTRPTRGTSLAIRRVEKIWCAFSRILIKLNRRYIYKYESINTVISNMRKNGYKKRYWHIN